MTFPKWMTQKLKIVSFHDYVIYFDKHLDKAYIDTLHVMELQFKKMLHSYIHKFR